MLEVVSPVSEEYGQFVAAINQRYQYGSAKRLMWQQRAQAFDCRSRNGADPQVRIRVLTTR